MDKAAGSLVLGHQNSSNYTVLIIAFAIILVLFFLYIIIKWLNNLHTSPQWIEMHRSLPTTEKNIAHIAKTANLDKDEKKMLETICFTFKAPNIEYLIRDDHAIDELFRKEYATLCQKNDGGCEQLKSNLFSLRYKLERAHNNTLIITSTKSIVSGQEFLYTDLRGTMWTFTLNENNPQGLFLTIPQLFASSNMKPEQLSKFDLNFTSKTGIAYILTVRLIRYETAKDGTMLMLIGHTNALRPMQRRGTKRIASNSPCTFSAVEVVAKGSTKNGEVEYRHMEKKYEGQLQDISANGCRLICSLPIKKGQYIYVDFAVSGSIRESAVGLIVMTTQTVDASRYILHIQFVQMALAVRNRIYAFIYNYN